jgi:hypothetical protein
MPPAPIQNFNAKSSRGGDGRIASAIDVRPPLVADRRTRQSGLSSAVKISVVQRGRLFFSSDAASH